MILVDTNIILYAEDSSSLHHTKAIHWWDQKLSGSETVGLCWLVISGFIRITTNPRIYKNPLSLERSVEKVQSWIEQPCVKILEPSFRHWEIYSGLLLESQCLGNLSSDAHLAAIAIEHDATLYSSDSDFGRFNGLKWKNLIA